MLRLLGLVAALLPLASAAHAQGSELQFWPEIDNFIKLGKPTRIYIPVSTVREDAGELADNGTVGIYLDYFTQALAPVRKKLRPDAAERGRLLLRGGYYYSIPGDGGAATNTLSGEFTGRVTLPGKILLSERNRFDFNFTDGFYDPRYRNRVRLERDLHLGGSFLTPYGYAEFFYSFNNDDWFRTRLVAGLEVHVWERVVPEVYYQADNNYGGTLVNVIGLVVSLYYR